ncbi:MAG: sulfotransferase [Paracoccaceae bacterium]|nr:sulfotransferase [Paracoccaceae bacterium]
MTLDLTDAARQVAGPATPDPLIDALFIGAGAMKAGTTWTYQMLDLHPDIFFSFEKEIHYFYAAFVDRSVLSDQRRMANVRDKYLRIDPGQNHAAGVRNKLHWAANYMDGPVDDLWYRNLFVFRRQERYVADFSNLYALLPAEGWRRIAGKVGTLCVLYTMRHPVKRLWSHVKFHLELTGQAEVLDRWGPAELGRFARQPFIWNNAEYGAALRRMREGLPAEALRPVFFETIHGDRAGFLADIEGFLGLAAHTYPAERLDRRVNASQTRAMPDFFPGLFARDFARIAAEVEAEGLRLPPSWADVAAG